MSGLKSLAQELPKYGRYGDSIVAHINPQEAALLKSLGGSGTINPHTGLPEFGLFSSVFRPIQHAVGQLNPFNPGSTVGSLVQQVPGVKETQNLATQVFQPIEKAVVQPVSAGLAQFDKAVGKAVPGGWGTLGMMAASMIPGMQPAMMAGLGAINGSGVLRRGGSFNLQGAMMGGAMAYGMSSLAQYAQGAAAPSTTGAESSVATLPVSESANVSYTPQQLSTLTSGDTGILNRLSAGIENGAGQGLQVAPDTLPNTIPNLSGSIPNTAPIPGSIAAQNAYEAQGIQEGLESAYREPSTLSKIGTSITEAPGKAIEAVKSYDYGDALKSYGENVSKTGEGIKNLMGLGEGTAAQASANAAANATKLGITNPMLATGATLYGATGLMALEEQRKYLEEQKAANAITQAEYDSALAEINRSEAEARKNVAAHPFSVNPNRDTSIGETYYKRAGAEENLYKRLMGDERLYAAGGSISGSPGMDSSDGIFPANLQPPSFMEGGNTMAYASGGMTPRFLSGGGDGMSDSIPATINGKQEARLADGEFVIPADVVSHLGNGSSKAGAKQLYSMMDKVRSARTGTKQQGKQINPRKYLPA